MNNRQRAILKTAVEELRPPYTGEGTSVVYPLLLCLTNDELIELFWGYIRHEHSISRVENLLSKRIHEEGHEAFTGLLDGIYATLPTLKWNHYCHLRKFLASIIRAFPEAEITRHFDYFYEDRKTYDRGKAIQVAHLVWTPDVERKVWEYFLATFDYTSYKLLLERSDFENFASIFKNLWRHEHFPFPQKIELLRRLAVYRFRALGFLKKESPLSYLHAVVLAGKKTLKGKEVLEIALTSRNECELGFSLWCLGKLGYWNELLEMKKKLPEFEQRFRYDKLRGYGIAEEDLAKYNEEYS